MTQRLAYVSLSIWFAVMAWPWITEDNSAPVVVCRPDNNGAVIICQERTTP